MAKIRMLYFQFNKILNLVFHTLQVYTGSDNAISFHPMEIRIFKFSKLSSHFNEFDFKLGDNFIQTIFFFDINKFSSKPMDELIDTSAIIF